MSAAGLGKRYCGQTAGGKYPKYNLHQMNIYVSKTCPTYTAIQIVCNIKCFDLFGKYQDALDAAQKIEFDSKIKEEYGLHDVDLRDLIDWEKYDYVKDTNTWNKKGE